jgi:hypothetical protein
MRNAMRHEDFLHNEHRNANPLMRQPEGDELGGPDGASDQGAHAATLALPSSFVLHDLSCKLSVFRDPSSSQEKLIGGRH